MEIKINKEIRDFQESVILGLSLRQFLFSIFACGVPWACISDYGAFSARRRSAGSVSSPRFRLPCWVLKYHGMTAEQFIVRLGQFPTVTVGSHAMVHKEKLFEWLEINEKEVR